MAQPLQCRWGVLGTGRNATRFLSDLQAAEKGKSSALPIQHSITAIAASESGEMIEPFARQHLGDNWTPSTSTLAPTVTKPPPPLSPAKALSTAGGSTRPSSSSSGATATGLLATADQLFVTPHVIDAVVIDSSPVSQTAHAKAALTAGIAVLLVRPVALSASEAKELMDLAKSKRAWLAVMMKESKRDKTSLRFIADECARCRERSLTESPQAPWEDNLAVLEALDEIRQSGSLAVAEPQPGANLPLPQISVKEDRVPSTPHRNGPSSTGQEARRLLPSTGDQPASSSSSKSSNHTAQGEPFPPSSDDTTEEEIDLAPRRFPRTPRPSGHLPDLAETPEDSGGAGGGGDSSLTDQSLGRDESISERPRRRMSAANGAASPAPSFAGGGLDSPTFNKKHLDSGNETSPTAAVSTTALRSQIHELKHLLRQKNAQISALQQQSQSGASGASGPLSLPTGGTSRKSAVRISMPVHGSGGLVPPTRPPRRRTSSVSSEVSTGHVRGSSPLSPRLSQTPDPLGETDMNHSFPSHPGDDSAEPSGRGTPSSRRGAEAGFLAPTKASAQRRSATLSQQANGIANRTLSNASAQNSPGTAAEGSSSSKGGHTGQVISHLTSELEAARTALESTKAKLATTQRNLASVTKSYETARDSLFHSRVENDRQATAAARKDRQHTEVLERARKAETEAKELGRASREWGTRVRQVESELGDVRRQQAKAEAGYEAITSAWKHTREHWESEVRGLRKQLEDVIAEHREKARSALEKFEAVEHEWKGREGERKGLEAVLEGLKQERAKAQVEVVQIVDDLVKRLETHEALRSSQEGKVGEVQQELARLLRLMRDGVVDPEKIRGK